MSTNLANTKQPARLAVGTHTWVTTTEDAVRQDGLINAMRKYGVTTIDTARIYGDGASEEAIGSKGWAKEFAITTKAATGFNQGSGRKIEDFANASLKALKTDKVRTYLLHAPDESVPVQEQMESIQKLYKEGKFEAFGLSNFTKDQVLEFYDYAKEKGYVLPSVYQSSYSLAARGNETLLFPTLRKLGMSIQAYSPMAGGLLAKTPEYIEQGKGSWDPNTFSGKLYRHLYYKPSYMKMLELFAKLSEESGISRSALAYRWVRYHSQLDGSLGDEMIVGASSVEQFEETLADVAKGPLDTWILERIDEFWELINDDAPADNFESARKLMGA